MAGGKAAEAWRSLNGGQQPLVELTARAAAAEVDAGMWQAWLADPDTRRRFEALVYRRGPDQCAYWERSARPGTASSGPDPVRGPGRKPSPP